MQLNLIQMNISADFQCGGSELESVGTFPITIRRLEPTTMCIT